MTNYKFGSVALVPFPFTGQTTSKKRPAVVISSERYEQNHLDLIVVAITSQQQVAVLPDHLIVANWQGAGLLKPSVIKPIASTHCHDDRLQTQRFSTCRLSNGFKKYI